MDDDEDVEDGGTYAAQLHRVFEGCDRSGTGLLGRAELMELCGKLHLQDQAGFVLEHLLADDDPEAKLGFDEFKEKFVCLLTLSVHNQQAEHEVVNDHCAVDDKDRQYTLLPLQQEREVDPKYVWGSKKYGRRSRPEVVNSSASSSSSSSEGSGSGTDGEEIPSNSSLSDVFGTASTPTQLNCTAASGELTGSTIRLRAGSSSRKQMGAKRRRRMESHDDDDNDSVRQSSRHYSHKDDDDGPFSGSCESAENEEEYLRSIWLRLGVGTDGYLDLEGLTQVCEHIGMEKMSDEVVDHLFEKLDVDRDGRIHFDEFMHLFRAGDTNQLPPSSADSTASNPAVDRGQSPSCVGGKKGDASSNDSTSNTGSNLGESGIFCCIDPQSTGYADQEVILELWDSLGITDGYGILKELGFHTSSQICLLDLTHVFEDILQMPNSDPDLTLAAFACYTHELKFLRRMVHQLRLERDYLLVDVADANSRAMLIAQEVDENQAKLELKSQENLASMSRKYQEQVRQLKEELECEQDSWNEQMAKLRAELQGELAIRLEADGAYRERLAELEKEISDAIRDKQKLERRLADAERRHEERLMEEEESFSRPRDEEDDDRSNESRCARLVMELEMTKAANKHLQDKNDELGAKVDKLKAQLSSKLSLEASPDSNSVLSEAQSVVSTLPSLTIIAPRPSAQISGVGHRRNGSWLSDYVKMEREQATSSSSGITCNNDLDGNCEPDGSSPSEFPGHGWFDRVHDETEQDEEYRPFCPTVGYNRSHWNDSAELQSAVQKLQVKRIFSFLKRRFIENYLEETNSMGDGTQNRLMICIKKEDVEPTSEIWEDKALLPEANSNIRMKKLSDSGFEDGQDIATVALSRIGNAEFMDSDKSSRLESVGNSISASDDAVDGVKNDRELTLDCRHQNWMQVMPNTDTHCMELHGKLASKTACLRNVVLEKDGCLRPLVQKEHGEIECDGSALEDKICEPQLSSAHKYQASDDCDSIITCSECIGYSGNIDTVGFGDEGNSCTPVRRSRSWREQECRPSLVKCETDSRRCLSAKSSRSSNSRLTKSTNSDDQTADFELDSLEVSDNVAEDKSTTRCQHRVPCCTKLEFYKGAIGTIFFIPSATEPAVDSATNSKKKKQKEIKTCVPWQLEMSQKHQETLKQNIRLIQLEFLTRGTTLERDAFRISDDKSDCIVDMEMLHAINQHVRQQEQRCRQLEAAMANGQLQASNELKELCSVKDEELRFVTQRLTKTRALLTENTAKVRELNEKLLQSDTLAKELYVENVRLMHNNQVLEEKVRVIEGANCDLQHTVCTLDQLLAETFQTSQPFSL